MRSAESTRSSTTIIVAPTTAPIIRNQPCAQRKPPSWCWHTIDAELPGPQRIVELKARTQREPRPTDSPEANAYSSAGAAFAAFARASSIGHGNCISLGVRVWSTCVCPLPVLVRCAGYVGFNSLVHACLAMPRRSERSFSGLVGHEQTEVSPPAGRPAMTLARRPDRGHGVVSLFKLVNRRLRVPIARASAVTRAAAPFSATDVPKKPAVPDAKNCRELNRPHG